MVLRPKQEKFCLEYAASGNAYQSAISAGYSENYAKGNAIKLLENESIKTRLQELYKKAESEKIMDIREMQEKLTSIIRQQCEEEVIVVENIGDFTSEARKMTKTAAIKDIINAVNTLGKMQGAFVDKVEQTVDMDLNIAVDYGDDSE